MTISLEEISQIMNEKTIVLANDSGPAHLASYMGSPVVVLYGITNAKKYKPNGKGKVITLQGINNDITTIPKDEVINAINSL